jgi:phosphoglucosamine mutase
MDRLFGTDGIRGQANCHPITPEVALQVGKAIGRVLEAGGHGTCRAVIGKDTRLSGYMLETALTSGLVSMGVDVFLVGPVPTPAVAHLTRSMGAAVGLMLTASHNPFDDNGVKVFGADGFKLSDELEARIEALVGGGNLTSDHIRSDRIGKAYRIEDARGRYIEFAKNTVGNLSLAGIKMVLDCANGAGYFVAPLIFRELGATVVKAYAEPDGYNINNGCGALVPETLSRLALEKGADVGVALDGDADRVVFCDREGRLVDGDRILAVCGLAYQARHRLAHDTLVVTTMSNLGLLEAVHAHGIRTVVTDVGDRQVIEAMRRGGYNLGGEKSGHVIFMDHVTTGDGIITALQVLALMKEKGSGIHELAAGMREYPQQLVSLPVKEKRPLEELPAVQAALRACREALGESGRCVLRYSGTERKIRFLVEAADEAAVRHWIGEMTAAIRRDLM